MNKKNLGRIAALALTLALVVLPLTSLAGAAGFNAVSKSDAGSNVKVPAGYDEHDYEKIVTFLETKNSEGKRNGEVVSVYSGVQYDPEDPTTWGGVKWTNDEVKRLKEVNWTYLTVGGVLDLSGCEALEYAECSTATLEAANFNGCINLDELEIFDSHISSLDIGGCGKMKRLFCYGNFLTELDVSGCPMLEFLSCNNNKISVLDISRNPVLRYLSCQFNFIEELDLTKCPNITDLYCTNNRIKTIDLTNCPYVRLLDKVEAVGSGSVGVIYDPYWGNSTINATEDNGVKFEGWYTPFGDLVSESNILYITNSDGESLVNSKEFYAKFSDGALVTATPDPDATPTPIPTEKPSAEPAPKNGWSFETDPKDDGWTYVDEDGDNRNWIWISDKTFHGQVVPSYDGNGIMLSEGLDILTGEPINPKNWFISPKFTAGTKVTFWLSEADPRYPDTVSVSITMNGGDNWVDAGVFKVTHSEFMQYEIDTSDYTGAEIQVGFCHTDSYDMEVVALDCVRYDEPAQATPVPETPVPETPVPETPEPETPTPGPVYSAGDINGDGSIDVSDALVTLREVMGLTEFVDVQQKDCADVNGDGVVDTSDALYIARIAMGLAEL